MKHKLIVITAGVITWFAPVLYAYHIVGSPWIALIFLVTGWITALVVMAYLEV
jgi:hypothetical protein